MTARFALAAAFAALGSALAAERASAPAAPAPGLPPGRETRVDEPKVGGGYFTVYVPSDYRASRQWPAIFCYHGQGGKQTVWPFREVTGGKGFIVVGMSYLDQSPRRLTTAEFDQQMAREAECVAAALARVEGRLAVDREQLFVGGFSMGGWMASSMAEACPELWAGVAILGAGRQKFDLPLKNPRILRNKPIYIGVGEKDPNFPAAQKGADFYRKAGAVVTFEKYDGLAHQMKMDTQVLPAWLLANGPQRQLQPRLAAARAAEQAGKLGKAFALYTELAQVSETSETCLAAADAAKRLAEQAEDRLAEAERALAERPREEAARLLAALATRYDGSPFGERADALIRKLQAERPAEPAPPPEKPSPAPATADRAERECRTWWSMADNYLRVQKPEKAREYLLNIIERHPDSEWAAKARGRLAQLKNE